MTKGEDYLRSYPKLEKWMNRCVSCGHVGHKPQLPERIGEGMAAQNLRSFFPPLMLNADGQCEQCAKAR